MRLSAVTARRVMLLAAGLAAAPLVVGQPEPERPAFYYSGERMIALRLEDDVVAVQLARDLSEAGFDDAVGDLLSLPAFANVGLDAIRELEGSSIVLIPTAVPVTRELLLDLTDYSTQDDAIRRVGQVAALDSSNELLIMMDRVVAELREGVPDRDLANAYSDNGVIVDRTNPVRTRRVILRLTPGSPGDALVVANRLYETGLFEFAEPEFLIRAEAR